MTTYEDTPETETNESLRKKMGGLRTSYFVKWLLPKWAADPKRLESVSVCEIVEEYIDEILKSPSPPQNNNCPHCGHHESSRPYGMNQQVYECNKCGGIWNADVMASTPEPK